MAPIDPNQLLAAFAPLLTPTGGIKNATEVPRLSSLMTKFSRKLVSRCVYCNVLLATSPDVLEEFLKSGGWKTIDQWIQSAKELGNKPFLNELCDLLLKLPMTVERLREENIKTPKIINKLSKSDDMVLAPKAKEIVEKWKKMIETAPGVTKDHNPKKHKRKKDSFDSASNDSKESNDNKKIRISANVIDLNNTDSNLSMDLIKGEDSSKVKVDRVPRPSTAKVKPGRSRLLGLVSSQTNSKAIKPRKESPNVPKNNKLIPNLIKSTNSIEVLNSLPITSKVKPQAIEIKPAVTSPTTPLTTTITVAQPVVTPPPPTVKHVLQDSTSFMDALIAPPSSQVLKKKRRPSASTSAKDSTNTTDVQSASSPKGSPPKPTFSFYKDMIDEKVDQRSNDSTGNQNDDNEDNDVFELDTNSEDKLNEDFVSGVADEESNHMNVDIVVPDISVDPLSSLTAPSAVISDRSSQKYKSILCYVKKGAKKSVRWVDDTRIQAVRFFELDETERVNVTRPPGSSGYGDLKRYDMKHEAEFMLMARRSANTFDVADDYLSRAETFSPWKLIICDGDTNLIEVGKDSKERAIQADRMRTTLETFYMRHQIPETPNEPEPEIFISEEQPKIIPLEDDNNPNNCHDFSNIELPQPKTGEMLPPRVADLGKAGPVPIAAFNTRMPFGAPAVSQGLGLPAQTPFNSGQQVIPPFAQNLDPFVAASQQPFFPSNNGPPSFQQPWSDSNAGPPPPQHPGPPPQHYGVPHFSHGPRGPMGSRPPRLPRNAQNTVCRHFARTGKCRFQPKCNFLHTNDR